MKQTTEEKKETEIKLVNDLVEKFNESPYLRSIATMNKFDPGLEEFRATMRPEKLRAILKKYEVQTEKAINLIAFNIEYRATELMDFSRKSADYYARKVFALLIEKVDFWETDEQRKQRLDETEAKPLFVI